jgi:hypothetical protein
MVIRRDRAAALEPHALYVLRMWRKDRASSGSPRRRDELILPVPRPIPVAS